MWVHREEPDPAWEGVGDNLGTPTTPVSPPQLKQETQSLSCCLLLVSEDNHQLFCQVGVTRIVPRGDSGSL